MSLWKERLQDALGRVPGLAEWDWRLRLRGVPLGRKSVQFLERHLPAWVRELEERFPARAPTGRRVMLFTWHDRWLLHNALLALALAAQGHRVTLALWPHPEPGQPITAYRLRQREGYLRRVLRPLRGWVHVAWLTHEPPADLPDDVEAALEQVTGFDVQYLLEREEVEPEHPLWALRRRRNRALARRLWHRLRREPVDVLLVPNGLILAFGVAYQVGRGLGLPVVTFEFGEQKDHMWLSQTEPVMRLPVAELWQQVRERPLSPEERARIERAMQDRWQGRVWERSQRRWQDAPLQGSRRIARQLGLDPARPLFLMAPNVFGDSMVLGAQVFTQGLGDWVRRTVQWFLERPQAQLVVRAHPGEKLLSPRGLSMAQVVRALLATHPAPNVVMIDARDPINTFDLVPLATAGLVYTSTVGMEMVLHGVPAVVVGRAFYRQKGFTLDPDSWEAYFHLLEALLQDPTPYRPTREQQELAWRFAYTFFYRFPQPYPWKLHLLEARVAEGYTPARVVQDDRYRNTWAYLTGTPLPWQTP